MPETQKLILLADDDVEDLELLQEALLQLQPQARLHAVTNGNMVLDYLEQTERAELPCLIVLDYNMPEINGAELLQQLGNEPRYQDIPKAVWSTSNSELYVKECMKNGAAAYFVKPASNKQLLELANQLLELC
ncbi:MAG: response regulator [Flavisolibacter sp.]